MTHQDQLKELRDFGGARRTEGLPDAVIDRFAASDPKLPAAVQAALETHRELRAQYGELLRGGEAELVDALQDGYLNFYAQDAINPYVPLGARGPWVVTSHGAVVHDSGGYGMLGFGHAPPAALGPMAEPWVMANVMTASFSQRRLVERLRREVGHTRGGCPFVRFLCLNSGSESVTLAARFSDLNAKRLTDPGGRHEGKAIKLLSLKGAFHGRTDRPAQFSDSTLPKYRANLASFRDRDNLITIAPNDVGALQQAFAAADAQGVFIEAVFLEPVMGEGNPGQAITPEFYAKARELTSAHGSLLLLDSIQAGLRAHGCLSIVDYPGFSELDPPDMETYSKALNAGQYPLSVLALTERAAALYARGVYGNTMTTNPRGLEVACAVLDGITPELRANIQARGAELVEKLAALKDEFPEDVLGAQGTGLLLAVELAPERLKVVGAGGVEEFCRLHGIGVIHGGKNALRFTPHFAVTSAEVDLIVDGVRQALRAFSPATA